jgi:hypothetical protein
MGPRVGLDDMEKFLTLPRLNSNPSVVQPVGSRYTKYAIPAPVEIIGTLKFLDILKIYFSCILGFLFLVMIRQEVCNMKDVHRTLSRRARTPR